MKIFIRELIRCAALLYLLGAPWAIVSSRVEGLAVVLLLAGILPAGSFLLHVLKGQLEVHQTASVSEEPTPGEAPESPEPHSGPQLRLMSNGTAATFPRRA